LEELCHTKKYFSDLGRSKRIPFDQQKEQFGNEKAALPRVGCDNRSVMKYTTLLQNSSLLNEVKRRVYTKNLAAGEILAKNGRGKKA
jgi:hypothetical protein